ncbi:hypothetical protein [Streptomyces sp. NPDC005435]|uniref:hypothetical protein n=1 Tax=Streptomyces sp. NPDC005435 TaxID=3154464 RepID=UPI0034533F93
MSSLVLIAAGVFPLVSVTCLTVVGIVALRRARTADVPGVLRELAGLAAAMLRSRR